MSKKKLLIIIIVVAVVAVLIIANFVVSTDKTTGVQGEEAKKRELVEIVSASGRIQPQTKVNITSEINGEIIALLVKEGDAISAGDLLIVLDTVQLRSDVDQARYAVTELNARLEGAKVTLDQAEEEFHRQEKLYEDKLTSETQYTAAKYAYLNAKSSHEATKASAKQVQSRYEWQLDNLSKAKIVAPMSGIVTYLDCEVGEIAPAQTAYTQGKTLMTISNLNVFEVEVEVDETEINKVDLNQVADIEVDAFPDTVFDGEVVEIGNTAVVSGLGTQDQSTNFNVKVIFKDPNVRIRPGMSATVDIVTDRRDDALTVPYSAIVMRAYDADSLEKARAMAPAEDEEGGGSGLRAAEGNDSTSDTLGQDEGEREEFKGVFVVRGGKAQFVPVETGIADQKYIEITSNLTEGDTVIAGPYRVLRDVKDGDLVEVTSRRGTETD
ncbi:MAG: efflux RND transporter periplasmic adaptor subunit [Candidatus Zixiibacteriota bacterium]